MSDIERVEQRLTRIGRDLDALRAARIEGIAGVAADPLRLAGVERLTQTAVQACVDAADQMLASEGIEEPPRSQDVFPALAGAGILAPALAERLRRLVGFRNVLAHEYLTVTVEDLETRVPEVIEGAQEFSEAAARWLQPRPR